MKCKYKYKNNNLKNKKCPHEALPDSDYCIWHKPKEGKDFSGKEIKETDLIEVYLVEANFGGAEFKKNTHLDYANLQKANLIGANLQEAYLEGANLQGADLFSANLQKAKLESANLQGTDLEGVNLQEANLKRANLQKAKLTWANLQGADLFSANLQGAKLIDANLQGTYLEGANLQGADLTYADLTNTLFDSESDLRGALLYTTEIKNAKGLQYAKISGKHTGEKCIEELIADKLNRILNSKKSHERNYEKALEEVLNPELRILGLTDKSVVLSVAKGIGIFLERIINPEEIPSRHREVLFIINTETPSKYKDMESRIKIYNNAKDIYINLKNYFKNVSFYDELAVFFVSEYRVHGKISKVSADKFAYALGKRIECIFHRLIFWKYYEEMDSMPLQEKKGRILLGNMIGKYSEFLINRLLSITSLYGESVGRVLLTALSIVAFYAGVYYKTSGIIMQNGAQPIHRFATSIYFSIVTFTTLGYGDLHPVYRTWVRLFAGSEAFLGAFLLAYFVVVVSRKIMR